MDDIEKNEDSGAYELSYLLTPLVAEEKLTEIIQQEILTPMDKLAITVVARENPKMTSLAYPIKKVVEHKGSTFSEAYLGVFRFTASRASASALDSTMGKSQFLIRHLLISLPRDCNYTSHQNVPARVAPVQVMTSPDNQDNQKEAIDKEIDKEIDGLLIK